MIALVIMAFAVVLDRCRWAWGSATRYFWRGCIEVDTGQKAHWIIMTFVWSSRLSSRRGPHLGVMQVNDACERELWVRSLRAKGLLPARRST